MTTETAEISIVCNHCDRDIPAQNIDLHRVHCARNLEKFKICGDMVPKKHAQEHFSNTHAPVPCSMCKETIECDVFDSHEVDTCPKRIVTCEFCEFPLPAVGLAEHHYHLPRQRCSPKILFKLITMRLSFVFDFNKKRFQVYELSLYKS